QIRGTLSASSRLFNTNVRGSVDYSLSEQTEIERISATIQRVLNERLNIRLNIIKETASDIPAKVTTSLDWLFDTYKISPELSVEEDGNFTIGFNLNFSLGKDPRNNDLLIRPNSMTSGGIVWAEAFMDDNGNSILDDDEEIIKNAEFRINGRKMSADNDNIATNVVSNRPNIVTLDIASLEDIFLQPSLEGYRVNLVPASLTKLLFPIQESTEIDGTAYFKDASGATKPLVYVNLELVNKIGEVVNSSSTAFDGFYIFNNVIPGEYLVRVKEEDMKRLSLIKESPVTVSVMPGDDDFYSGYDLYVIRADSK
ncbi:MAG: carboxypeptidase-like regulatory domain-containing protein, partial [Rickettsiales bacterium]|nr:carboxypeptidase-like regulatory domain-containing protein [Rickettsiales bacterium]